MFCFHKHQTSKMKKYISGLNCLVLICISFFFGAFSIRFWEMDFSVYPALDSDYMLGSMLIKSIQENGIMGYFFNNSIGAPTGSSLIDAPFLDPIYVFMCWLIGLVVNDVAAIYYLMYLLPFPMISVTMYYLLRRFKINRWTADVVSILATCAPYHFYRGLGHTTLANYFMVPLAIYLAFAVLEGDWNKQEGKRRNRCLMVFFSILVAIGPLYYAFFAVMLLCVALLIRTVKQNKISEIWKNSVPILVVICGFLLSILPKVLYGVIEGENTLAGIRYPFEAEIYGLKIVQMILPVSYSRIPFLARVTNAYSTSFPLINENGSASLGLIGDFGFIILCGICFSIFFINEKARKKIEHLNFCALSVLCLTVYCTVGGFGTLFAILVSPQIRALNRASIYISCFCFLAIAMLIDTVCKKYKKMGYLLTLMVFFVGMYDQFFVFPAGWQYEIAQKQDEYQDFFSRIEESAEDNAMIYLFPFIDYPEYGVYVNITDYTHFLGYLLTDDIKWSYGAVRGRYNVAKEIYLDEGMSEAFLSLACSNGYTGVIIDRFGYEDGGNKIINWYMDFFGGASITSADDRYYYFAMDKYHDRVAETEVLSIAPEWRFDKEVGLATTECLIEANNVYKITIEFEWEKKPEDAWIDFYGGEGYDDEEQQRTLIFSNRDGEYQTYISSGDFNEEDFYPIQIRLAVATETECEVKELKVTRLDIQ